LVRAGDAMKSARTYRPTRATGMKSIDDGKEAGVAKQPQVADGVRRSADDARGPRSETDRQLEAAQAEVLARYAPDTRVRRLRWSRGETQVLELGEGPPLLLVHGGFAAAFYWIPIFPALARTHRVIALDWPGHGLADPCDFRSVDLFEQGRTFLGDVLDSLGLQSVDLVGSSFGGFWSVVFAIHAPERVSRLVLVGGPAGVTRGVPLLLRSMTFPWKLPGIGLPVARLMMSKPTRENNRKFWGKIIVAHPEQVDDTVLDADVASMRRNLETNVSFIKAYGRMRGLRRDLVLGERWLDLKTATSFICGDRDAFVSRKDRKTWDRILARSEHIRFVPISDAGHLPWIDDPQRVVSEIERFLTEETQAPRTWGQGWNPESRPMRTRDR
jgi:pimeloyl-ACP methyl ester carboxylesterase